ncbi:MAG: hypothetical protein JWO25_838, partial [Alphaproteobacteria bacterium]|nr:hypothetical protein [Alphaproteobacteria bacterium]
MTLFRKISAVSGALALSAFLAAPAWAQAAAAEAAP